MYEGADRVKQVDAIRTLAADIVAYSGIESPADVRLAVAEWVGEAEMPDWYSDHDQNLLLKWIAAEVLGNRLYQQATGYVHFVELECNYPGRQATGVEIVVLTPEKEVAFRFRSDDTDGDWELGLVEQAAEFVIELDEMQAAGK